MRAAAVATTIRVRSYEQIDHPPLRNGRKLAFEEHTGSGDELRLRFATASTEDDLQLQPVCEQPTAFGAGSGDEEELRPPEPIRQPTGPPGHSAPKFLLEDIEIISSQQIGTAATERERGSMDSLTVPGGSNGPGLFTPKGGRSQTPSYWGDEIVMSRKLSGQSGLAELAELAKQDKVVKEQKLQEYIEKRKKLVLGVRHIHLDVPEGTWSERAHMLLSWVWFDFCVGLVILANSITIGVEAIYKTKAASGEPVDMPAAIGILDNVFLAIYTVELSLRLFAYGMKAFRNGWVRFDALLVGSGAVEIVLGLVLSSVEQLEQLMLVRMLRLTRLARMVRFFSQFRVLWALVSGLMHSVNTLVWTFVLLISLLYIFAVLSIDLLPKEAGASDAYNEAASNFNSGLGNAMLTLLQFLSFDSIGVIYVPIIKEKPHLALYFITVVLLVSICLMNLVIAVMVEMNIEASRADRDIQKLLDDGRKKKLMPILKELFKDLDEDGSGDVELEEIINAPDEAKAYLQEVAKGLDLEELYLMLDYDGSGAINSDEFCEGLIKASTSDKPLELLRLVSAQSDIISHLRDARRLLEDHPIDGMQKRVEKVEDNVLQLGGRLDSIEADVARIADFFRRKAGKAP